LSPQSVYSSAADHKEPTQSILFLLYYLAVRFSTIALNLKGLEYTIIMAEKEYKEKVKIDDDEAKIERESKDSFGNKVKEKHEIKQD
jgi:hypothetical protein